MNLIIATVPVTNSAHPTSCTPAVHCIQHSATMLDLWITIAICATVVLSIGILAIFTYKIVKNKHEEDTKNQSNVKDDSNESLNKDKSTEKDRFDVAWRFVDMCWRVEHPAPSKAALPKDSQTDNEEKSPERTTLTEKDKERYEQAWAVVKRYIDGREI